MTNNQIKYVTLAREAAFHAERAISEDRQISVILLAEADYVWFEEMSSFERSSLKTDCLLAEIRSGIARAKKENSLG